MTCARCDCEIDVYTFITNNRGDIEELCPKCQKRWFWDGGIQDPNFRLAPNWDKSYHDGLAKLISCETYAEWKKELYTQLGIE